MYIPKTSLQENVSFSSPYNFTSAVKHLVNRPYSKNDVCRSFEKYGEDIASRLLLATAEKRCLKADEEEYSRLHVRPEQEPLLEGKFCTTVECLLNWDCNLEQNAFLRNCDNNINFATGYSEVSATIKLTGKPCDIEKETKTTLNKLWNEALKADLSQNPIYDNTTIMNFGRMVYWAADGFACTYNKACSDKLRCLYTADPKNGKPLYKVGSTCKSAPGYCLPGYTCVDYLCKKNTEYIPTQATLPLYCQPGTDGLTFEQQNAAANMMNYYRRLLGTGWAEDKNGYAPIARMLYPLVYLCKTIGKASKEIADKCVMPPYTATHGHILSYHIIKKLNVDPKAALEEAIKTWAGQLKKVDPQTIGGAVFYQDEVEEKASDWAKVKECITSSS
ncbi:hypothetical protein Y032_0256g353 [Ancylostoma ceylanicum]|nr:hypothetical protein Y032_0256g353 [Ancylostoma ceylanicum]